MNNKITRRKMLKTGAATAAAIAAPSVLAAQEVVFKKPIVAALNAP